MATVGIREAARLLGVSMDTIRRRIDRGDLPAHKDASGRWLVELDDTLIPPQAPAPGELGGADREELIRLRAENQALQQLLEEVRTSRDRTVEAEAELRRIIAVLAVRIPGLPPAETETPELLEKAETPRRWWQRRRPEGHAEAGDPDAG